MRFVPGGMFAMGSEDLYPEERPVQRLTVDGFWMDEMPVTAYRPAARQGQAIDSSTSHLGVRCIVRAPGP